MTTPHRAPRTLRIVSRIKAQDVQDRKVRVQVRVQVITRVQGALSRKSRITPTLCEEKKIETKKIYKRSFVPAYPGHHGQIALTRHLTLDAKLDVTRLIPDVSRPILNATLYRR